MTTTGKAQVGRRALSSIAVAVLMLLGLPVAAAAAETTGVLAGPPGVTLAFSVHQRFSWDLGAFQSFETEVPVGYELRDVSGRLLGFALRIPTAKTTLMGRTRAAQGSVARYISLSSGRYQLTLLAKHYESLLFPVTLDVDKGRSNAAGARLNAINIDNSAGFIDTDASENVAPAAKYIVAVEGLAYTSSRARWQDVCITGSNGDCSFQDAGVAQLPSVTPSISGSAGDSVEYRIAATTTTGFGKRAARCQAASVGASGRVTCAILTLEG